MYVEFINAVVEIKTNSGRHIGRRKNRLLPGSRIFTDGQDENLMPPVPFV